MAQLSKAQRLTTTIKTALIVLALFFSGCAMGPKPQTDMPISYQHKSFLLLRAFNQEFAEYQKEVKRDDLDPQEVRVLDRKLVLLKELHPLIGKYYRSVVAIGCPTPELTPQITPRLKELLGDELLDKTG